MTVLVGKLMKLMVIILRVYLIILINNQNNKPKALIAKTIKGKGFSFSKRIMIGITQF